MGLQLISQMTFLIAMCILSSSQDMWGKFNLSKELDSFFLVLKNSERMEDVWGTKTVSYKTRNQSL